jgi:hypothetical protein
VADNVSRIAKEGTQYGLGLLDPNPQGVEFTESIKAGVRYPFEMLGKAGDAVQGQFGRAGNALQGPYGRTVDFFTSPEGENKERYADYNYWKNYDPNAGAPYGPQQQLTMPEMEPEMGQQPNRGLLEIDPRSLPTARTAGVTDADNIGEEGTGTGTGTGGLGTLADRIAEYKAALDKVDLGNISPMNKAARKKEDFWSALAQFGFGMASSKSPYLLQAAGEAGSGVMPVVRESLKDRRATDEKEAALKASMGVDAVKGGYGMHEKDLDRVERQKDRVAAAANAAIATKGYDRSQIEDYKRIHMARNPGISEIEALALAYGQKQKEDLERHQAALGFKETELYTKAHNAYNDLFGIGFSNDPAFRKAQKEGTLEQFKQNWINNWIRMPENAGGAGDEVINNAADKILGLQ